jgi:hypothetical protein
MVLDLTCCLKHFAAVDVEIADQGDLSPIISIETNLNNLSAANIILYSSAIASLDEAIDSFRQLPDYARKATEMRFWTRFRQGMHEPS